MSAPITEFSFTGRLFCLESLAVETHRTRDLQQALTSGLGFGNKARLVPEDESRNLTLAARNNPRLKVVRALGLSVVDLLQYETILVSEPALQRLNEVLAR